MNKIKLFLILNFIVCIFQIQLHASSRSEEIKTAVEYLSECGNFIRFDSDYVYTGFGTYWTSNVKPRQNKPSIMRFVPIDKLTEFQIETLDSVIDVVRKDSSTYVLTYSGIEEWDLKQFKRIGLYKTSLLSRPLIDEEHPKAFVLYKDKIIIAHGRLGFSFFDIKTKSISKMIPLNKSQLPLESVANGISISDRKAIAAIDSYSLVSDSEKPAFRGLVTLDLETETVVSALDGMEPGADSITSDNNVTIVSFYGQPLLKYSISSLSNNSKMPMPLKRFWKFPITGKQKGKASLDEKYYYTCFSRMPNPGEGSYFINVPMVFDRRVLMLD